MKKILFVCHGNICRSPMGEYILKYLTGNKYIIESRATSLEEKAVNLEKDTFYDGGSVNVDGARIKCWKHGGHGAQTFLEVVQNSCNLGIKPERLLHTINP